MAQQEVSKKGGFKRFFGFLENSYQEMVTKVTWTKYSELQSTSILVLIASLIFALLIRVMDLGFENLSKAFYSLVTGQSA